MLPCSVTAIAGIFSFDRLIEQLVDPAGAVEQRELGVEMKVNELSHRSRHSMQSQLAEHPISRSLRFASLTPTRSSTAASS